MTQVHMFIHN